MATQLELDALGSFTRLTLGTPRSMWGELIRKYLGRRIPKCLAGEELMRFEAYSQENENDTELTLLRAMIIASWRENRPREFRQLSSSGQLRSTLDAKLSVVWDMHRSQVAQGCMAFESRELLRDSISLPLEDDHPWALMDLCDDLEELDLLLDERKRAIEAGGEILLAWDVKITHMRRLRGLD